MLMLLEAVHMKTLVKKNTITGADSCEPVAGEEEHWADITPEPSSLTLDDEYLLMSSETIDGFSAGAVGVEENFDTFDSFGSGRVVAFFLLFPFIFFFCFFVSGFNKRGITCTLSLSLFASFGF